MALFFGRYPQPVFRFLRSLPALVSWQGVKAVTWVITVVSTPAQSYLNVSGHSAAGAVELAVSRKEVKYSFFPRAFFLY